MLATVLPEGSLIAGYRIESLAGQGGMGVVYRATQLALGRPVALKLISPDIAGDELFRERFKRESRLAASIDHPNVIPVYEAGETDGTLFISMRWVEGTDLSTLIRASGALEPGRAASVVAQVGAGLDAAHERGLVHRDVKPANVLVAGGRADHVYLTDFGLVKRLTGGAQLTRSGEFVGTLDYIAPEQIMGKGADACSDVYSLGCVLFQCLSGRVPFQTDSEIAKIYAHLNEPPPRLSEVVPGMPTRLDEVVLRAMAKERGDRYPSAGDLGRAAVAATNGAEGPSTLAQPTRAASTEAIPEAGASRPRRRRLPRRRLLAGAASIAVGASAVVILALAGVFGGGHASVPVSAATAAPPDGSLVRASGDPRVYIVKADAKFALPRSERDVFGYEQSRVRTISDEALAGIPDVPRSGSLIKAYRSSIIWSIDHGTRQLGSSSPGEDVAVVPSTGLAQIPLPASGRKTSLVAVGPTAVKERARFKLLASVHSPNGIPSGACVFYRIFRTGLRERANTPTSGGRCLARLRISGVRRVRYSVHFIGDPGWRTSKNSVRPIDVLPR